jgi:hypothetical protein
LYDAFFEGSEVNKIYTGGLMTVRAGGDFMFRLTEPVAGEAVTSGNGTMAGFNLGSADKIERLYKKALELGGTDEGEPRMQSGLIFSVFKRFRPQQAMSI